MTVETHELRVSTTGSAVLSVVLTLPLCELVAVRFDVDTIHSGTAPNGMGAVATAMPKT